MPCASAMLRIRAGRQGENTGAHGDIAFTNVGSRPCLLRGVPGVAIVQADGKSMPVRLVRAPNLSFSPAVPASAHRTPRIWHHRKRRHAA